MYVFNNNNLKFHWHSNKSRLLLRLLSVKFEIDLKMYTRDTKVIGFKFDQSNHGNSISLQCKWNFKTFYTAHAIYGDEQKFDFNYSIAANKSNRELDIRLFVYI